MPTITVTLTENQKRALETEVLEAQSFVEDYVVFRANKTLQDIVNKTTSYCISQNISIPPTQDAILEFAFENGLAKPLTQVVQEQQESLRPE